MTTPTPSDPATATQGGRPWYLFRNGRSAFAVGLEAVAEVVEVDRLIPIPHSPPRVVGLCTLRREIIPVVELSGEPARPPEDWTPPAAPAKSLLLLLRTARGTWAVRVNPEGTAVSDGSDVVYEPDPDGPPGRPRAAVLRRFDTSYAVIDPEAVWQEVRQSVVGWYHDHWGTEPGPSARD